MKNLEIFTPNYCRAKETEASPSAFIVLDLDGVTLRNPQNHTITPEDYALMGERFAKVRESGGTFGVITNRPPGEMQITAYYLGVNKGIWVTESGGSAYDVKRNTTIVLPQWQEYAEEKVPSLRKSLKDDLGIGGMPRSFDDPQYIPALGSIKTVIIPPENVPIKDYASDVIVPYLDEKGLLEDFRVDVGKAIDIDPKKLSKGPGMVDLLRLNDIDPRQTPTLFIADHTRDIEGAQMLTSLGGMVAAVGNANEDYKDYVRKEGGIIAPADSEYHSSVAAIMTTFFKNLQQS